MQNTLEKNKRHSKHLKTLKNVHHLSITAARFTAGLGNVTFSILCFVYAYPLWICDWGTKQRSKRCKRTL